MYGYRPGNYAGTIWLFLPLRSWFHFVATKGNHQVTCRNVSLCMSLYITNSNPYTYQEGHEKSHDTWALWIKALPDLFVWWECLWIVMWIFAIINLTLIKASVGCRCYTVRNQNTLYEKCACWKYAGTEMTLTCGCGRCLDAEEKASLIESPVREVSPPGLTLLSLWGLSQFQVILLPSNASYHFVLIQLKWVSEDPTT